MCRRSQFHISEDVVLFTIIRDCSVAAGHSSIYQKGIGLITIIRDCSVEVSKSVLRIFKEQVNGFLLFHKYDSLYAHCSLISIVYFYYIYNYIIVSWDIHVQQSKQRYKSAKMIICFLL